MSRGTPVPASANLLADTSRVDLEATWHEREDEAACLNAAGYRSTAVALRCYALEIRLKALICQHLALDYLPSACKTHDLLVLIVFTGLLAELDLPANGPIRRHWDFLVIFNKQRLNDLRYRKRADLSDADADRIDRALDDPQAGITAWLSRPR